MTQAPQVPMERGVGERVVISSLMGGEKRLLVVSCDAAGFVIHVRLANEPADPLLETAPYTIYTVALPKQAPLLGVAIRSIAVWERPDRAGRAGVTALRFVDAAGDPHDAGVPPDESPPSHTYTSSTGNLDLVRLQWTFSGPVGTPLRALSADWSGGAPPQPVASAGAITSSPATSGATTPMTTLYGFSVPTETVRKGAYAVLAVALAGAAYEAIRYWRQPRPTARRPGDQRGGEWLYSHRPPTQIGAQPARTPQPSRSYARSPQPAIYR
jgi:hypothetical protein